MKNSLGEENAKSNMPEFVTDERKKYLPIKLYHL